MGQEQNRICRAQEIRTENCGRTKRLQHLFWKVCRDGAKVACVGILFRMHEDTLEMPMMTIAIKMMMILIFFLLVIIIVITEKTFGTYIASQAAYVASAVLYVAKWSAFSLGRSPSPSPGTLACSNTAI